ncbi:MAG: glycosyltransferase, partial [Desulfocapsaceae bacterium]|nr:glycosyltransferase [Desulfocapsaceae bacterium]
MRKGTIKTMVAGNFTVVQIVPEMDEGGVEGETLDFAIYLAQHGHRSIVISGGGRLVEQLQKHGVEHVQWRHIGAKSLRCLKYLSRLKNFLINENVDVLHLRSRLPAWIGYLAWKKIEVAKRPALVTSFHGFYSVNAYSTIMTKGERIIAVSNVIKNHIVENYDPDPQRIKLIHGGYDERAFSPDTIDTGRSELLRKKWRVDSSVPVIMLPGRLTTWKGQDIFIQALGIIKERPFVALCVGDIEDNPSFTKKLKDLIERYGLEDKVRLVGHCADMPAALSIADLVVSASSLQPEAFGKVAIEAMAMGKPVIATGHGGSLETIRDRETGWLVNPGDPQSLADALGTAIDNAEDLPGIGRIGREWVEQRFTAVKMCERTLALYRELIREKTLRKSGEILSVAQLLPDLDGGGVERGTLELGKYLSENNHRSFVVSSGGRLVDQLVAEGSKHICWAIGTKSPAVVRYFRPLRNFLIREQIDILHLRSRMPAWLGFAVWKTLPKEKRPILVTTFHGFYSVNRYSAIMTKGMGKIAVSKGIERHIQEKYGVKKGISLIYRGVDKNIFDPQAVSAERIEKYRKKWQVQAGLPVIMLPGRLTPWKGQDTFIEALSLLKDIDYQAFIVGDTAENHYFTEQLETLIGRYRLKGSIT